MRLCRGERPRETGTNAQPVYAGPDPTDRLAGRLLEFTLEEQGDG
jgi:hypothetical protein